MEEHDPTGIYADPSPADAIEPFSAGKIALINSGYFQNAGYSGTGGKTAYTPGFLTQDTTSTAPDSNPAYDSSRGLYFVIRNADLGSTTRSNRAVRRTGRKTLFAGATSVIGRPAERGALLVGRFHAAYKDCGVDPTSC